MILPIAAQDLARLLERGLPDDGIAGARAHLFDVRDPAAFQAGHIPRAMQVPDSNVVRWIPQQAQVQELVILVDDEGAPHGAARHVGAELVHKWFRRVRYLAGGMRAWEAARLPLETGGPTGPGAASHDGAEPQFHQSAPVPWLAPRLDVAGRP